MESGTICKPSSSHARGGPNRQRRYASKHIIGEGGDAEARVVFPRTTATSTTNYLQQEAHTYASLSKQSSEPYFLSQSRKHWDQTSCLLAPYDCSGSGTKRES